MHLMTTRLTVALAVAASAMMALSSARHRRPWRAVEEQLPGPVHERDAGWGIRFHQGGHRNSAYRENGLTSE